MLSTSLSVDAKEYTPDSCDEDTCLFKLDEDDVEESSETLALLEAVKGVAKI